jgi:hypothetical protein
MGAWGGWLQPCADTGAARNAIALSADSECRIEP